MKLSVIVPIYKVENYLRECIDSIINQTYKNIEIILVDDGSPDDCGKICDEYEKKDKRIKVIHKKNGGLSDARNKGLEIATGDYVIFIDSDDYVSDKLCETVNNYITKTNSDIVQYNFLKFDDGENFVEDKEKKIEYELYKTKNDINYNYLFEETITRECWNKAYKRELFDNIKYPVGKIAEDLATTYKIINNSKSICYLKTNLYFYRVRNNSIMTTGSIKLMSNAVEAHYDIFKFYSNGFDKKFKIKAYSNYYNNLIKLISYEKKLGLSDSMNKLDKIEFNELNFKSKIVYILYRVFPNILLDVIYNKKVRSNYDCNKFMKDKKRKITLEEMKKIEVGILKYIDDICLKNNIQYYAIGGTLLGAIRHDGFIPWDDDIDIALKREDYNKLVKAIYEDNNSKYKVIDNLIGSDTYFPFAKCIDIRTDMHEKSNAKLDGYGVYVDIFAIDVIPEDLHLQKEHYDKLNKYRILFLKSIILDDIESKNIIMKIIRKFMIFICNRIIGRKKVVEKQISMCEEYNHIENPKYYMCCWPSYSVEHEIIDAKNVEKVIRHKFENIEINIPENYDAYLTTLFGDYMKLPPKEKQVTHHNFEAYWKEDIKDEK